MTDTKHPGGRRKSLKAVALIDALGFREICRNNDPTKVVEVLRKAKRNARISAGIHNEMEGSRMFAATFSDTTVVACTPERSDEAGLVDAVRGIARNIGHLAMQAAKPKPGPALNYRGCIAVGTLAIGDDIVVGEALIEAAEWYEKADAAIVWLTPGAARTAKGLLARSPWFLKWPVPLKDGGALETLALNPLWALASGQNGMRYVPALVQRFLEPFDGCDKIDVVRKRQNTAAFLAEAVRCAGEHRSRTRDAEEESNGT